MRSLRDRLNSDMFDDDEPAPSPAAQHAFAAELQSAVKRRLREHEMQYDEAPMTDGEYEALKEAYGASMLARAREIVAERGFDQSRIAYWTDRFNGEVA